MSLSKGAESGTLTRRLNRSDDASATLGMQMSLASLQKVGGCAIMIAGAKESRP